MTVETIDLYQYFKMPRGDAKCGTLTAYRHGKMPELGVEKERPAMLVIPGGGYAFVSAREGEPVAMRFFAEGYDAFVLEYDVAPNCSYPVQITQAAMAMLYLRRESKTLAISQNHIAAVGFSAGGHLCGCISLLWDDPALVALFGKEECEGVRPDASILSYPVVTSDPAFTHRDSFLNFCGQSAKTADYSLEMKVRPSASPCFIWSTTTDGCVPVENSVLLYSALHRAGVSAELHLFEEGVHGMSVCSGEVEREEPTGAEYAHVSHWMPLAVEFLKSHGFAVKIFNQ